MASRSAFIVAISHMPGLRLADVPGLVEAVKQVAPYIDYDAEHQDREIRKIVTILHAVQQARDAHGRLIYGDGRSPMVEASRCQIRGALTGYRGAVTALVLQGNLSIDQGEELMRIVDKVESEQP
jgi:hypothetical protein